ncbi:siderophore transcription factor [Moniliophthora roreri]|uniref:GATA-type domain-containing protein n=1 Tax=Moniliophthora roreri TaxID=221103 RepID=A0A0W0FM21_MONRR|nr:siderophore transcription factor [Moniliophthora roreri]
MEHLVFSKSNSQSSQPPVHAVRSPELSRFTPEKQGDDGTSALMRGQWSLHEQPVQGGWQGAQRNLTGFSTHPDERRDYPIAEPRPTLCNMFFSFEHTSQNSNLEREDNSNDSLPALPQESPHYQQPSYGCHPHPNDLQHHTPSQHSQYYPSLPYLSPPLPPNLSLPHLESLPVRYTDDAAVKEGPFLRRMCFNCRTTEPPSWRRYTLSPGKIVCNKCGIYAKTHQVPRPNHFNHLRPGKKSRKGSKSDGRPTLKVKKSDSVYSTAGSFHVEQWDAKVQLNL